MRGMRAGRSCVDAAPRGGEIFVGGNRLGPAGSRILAEVCVGLLQTDSESFLHPDQDPAWRPTLPSAFAGHFTMPDLLRYVAAHEPAS